MRFGKYGIAAILFAISGNATAQPANAAKARAGEDIFAEHCAACHGEKLRNTGQTFDLRKFTAGDRDRYDRSVLNGKGQMPPWAGVLTDAEIDQVWHYIRANAEDR